MANQYKNKIIYNGESLIDLTSDTVSAATLLNGETAHDKSGAPIVGTYVPFTPSGNIDITQAGVTNVTNYATATIPEATIADGGVMLSYSTINNQRKCTLTPWTEFNGGYINNGIIETYGEITDAIPSNTTITPTTSTQTIGGRNYIMEGSVTIAAMPTYSQGQPELSAYKLTDVYVGTLYFPNYQPGYVESPEPAYFTIDLQDETVTPSLSQQVITPTDDYHYLNSVTVNAMPTGVTTSPTSISGTTATVSTGTNTLTLTKTVSVTPRVTTVGYVSAGTAGNSSVSLTANVTTKAAATITPGTSNQTIASGTYLTGTQTISGDVDLVAGNIKTGVNIFGVAGSYTSDATAAAADILSGETAYVNGSKLTGTLEVQNFYTGSSSPSSSLGQVGDLYLQM